MPFAMPGMSIQGCCRDQRKIGQVIVQMKVLGNNLDELREEITALRNIYSEKQTKGLYANELKNRRNSKTNMLEKVKKYIRKVTSVSSLKKGLPTSNSSKDYYPCENLDPSLPASLNYMCRMTKKEGLLQMPTRTKYFKRQANQTDAKFQHRHIRNKPTVSMCAESTEDVCDRGSPFAKGGSIQQSKVNFPQKDSTPATKYSDISCELTSQVDNPICSPSAKEINIFPDSCIIKNYSENMGVCLLNGNHKQTVTKSTQTNAGKLGQKGKYPNSRSKNPNCYFSKIRNAVITKKILQNSSKNTFTVCGNVNNTKRHHYLKKEVCKQCTCKKGRNDSIDSSDKETSKENFFLDKNDQGTDRWSTQEDTKYQTLSFEELPNLSCSSTSENLETNVSDNSNMIEEFPQRKKPRTYLIRKTTWKHNDNWLKHFEKSVVYVGQTSNLNLSSCSFSNENVSCD